MFSLTQIYLNHTAPGPRAAWVFNGGCNLIYKEKISVLFAKYVKFEQEPGYNYWIISNTTKNRFSVKRMTWRSGSFNGSIEDVEKELSKYYKK